MKLPPTWPNGIGRSWNEPCRVSCKHEWGARAYIRYGAPNSIKINGLGDCLNVDSSLSKIRLAFRYLAKVTDGFYDWTVSHSTMATPTLDPKTSDTVQALVQLLRSRSSEEIRQRMYDNPPGSPWWAACKTELDLRNSERAATALVDTSRILDKLRSATDHLDELTGKLVQATTDMAEVVKSVRESGRRMEVATYVIVGLTIVQLFYIAFQFSTRH
jgi:hypothetical protein